MGAKTEEEASLSLAALQEPANLADPYPFYAHLRSTAPVHWDASREQWTLTRHADVMALLRDPRMSAKRLLPGSPELLPAEVQEAARQVFRALPHQMLFIDPPDHSRIRGLVNKAFTPRLIENMRAHIEVIAEELLDAVAAAGEMDAIKSLAYPLPAIVIAEMLGVPPEDRDQFTAWSADFGAFLDGNYQGFDEAMLALRGIAAFMDYFREIIARQQAEPQENLLHGLLVAREQGDMLSEDELLANLVLLLAAGHGTTTHLIGNGLLALLRNPEALRLLKEHPEIASTAVPELLRYDSPVQMTGRKATIAIEVDGRHIAEGQHVVMVLGAANRDPAQFRDPDRLDLERSENRHLSFGHGVHFCLGAPLARLEAGIALNAALRRLPNLRLALAGPEQLQREPGVVFRGVRSLPVAWD